MSGRSGAVKRVAGGGAGADQRPSHDPPDLQRAGAPEPHTQVSFVLMMVMMMVMVVMVVMVMVMVMAIMMAMRRRIIAPEPHADVRNPELID